MVRSKCGFWSVLTVLIALAPVASGQGLPKASPRSVGLSQERLDRITALMQKHVEDGLLAGAVALVARDGKVAYLKSVGMQDKERGVEMKPDAIFRIASMSKPITSVAVMVLNGGELDGIRLLSRKTVELMTADHVGDLNPSSGFGLGFGVTLTRGLTSDTKLWSWRQEVVVGKVAGARQKCTITMMSQEGKPVAIWELANAWPSDLTMGTKDAGDAMIEQVTLTHEGVTRKQ